MIDIDIARRLREAGLPWTPADGDLFVIDNAQLRDEPFMLSSMVVETGTSRGGRVVFRFNGTTEWALDSVEQHEALWIPREDQLREALGEDFLALRRLEDGSYSVSLRAPDGATRDVPAPHAEDALAGALLIHLSRQVARSRWSAPAGPGRATGPVGPVGRARPVGPVTQAVPPARPAAAVAHRRSSPPRRTAPPPPSPAIALASRHRAPPWRRGRAVPFPRSRPPASRKGGTARLHRRVIAGCGRVIAGPGRPHLPGPPRPRRTTSRAR